VRAGAARSSFAPDAGRAESRRARSLRLHGSGVGGMLPARPGWGLPCTRGAMAIRPGRSRSLSDRRSRIVMARGLRTARPTASTASFKDNFKSNHSPRAQPAVARLTRAHLVPSPLSDFIVNLRAYDMFVLRRRLDPQLLASRLRDALTENGDPVEFTQRNSIVR
jgi:hypothetical protein